MKAYDCNQFILPIKNGNGKAFKEMYDLMHPLLVRHLYKLTHKSELSEELVNDIFMSLWKNRETVEITTSLKAYLYRAATNKAYDYYRKKERQPDMYSIEASEQIISSGTTAEDKINYSEMEHRVLNCVDKLPERCRLIFSLSRFSQYSRKKIAEELDISIKTIENQMTKALKLMKNCVFDKTDRGEGQNKRHK